MQSSITLLLLLLACILLAAHSATAAVSRFAVLGDYGRATSPGEKLVADMIDAWNPDAIFTLGDNNYPVGAWSTIDANIGQFYGKYIYPLADSNVSTGAADKQNKFWSSLGNHGGYSSGFDSAGNLIRAYPYLRYLRGIAPNMSANNGELMLRYYDVHKGPVHFFMLNSNSWEPDGITADSVQATWLKNKLSNCDAPHRVVCWHHLPFSNNNNDAVSPQLRWPFVEWGISVILSGHAHTYERFQMPNFPPSTVNGLGGTVPIYGANFPLIPGTQVWFNETWGAQFIEADAAWMNITFTSVDGKYRDVLRVPAVNPQKQVTTTAAAATPPPSLSTTAAGAPATNSPSSGNKDSTSSHSNEAGKGMGVGILIGIIIAMCVFGIGWVIVWYRRQRSERVQEALGGGGGGSSSGSNSHRHFARPAAVAMTSDYVPMQDQQLDNM